MDPGYRSPLVELFLRGEAARDVRLLAARGLLARPAQEQIALLVVLCDDPDSEIAAQAHATIALLPREALEEFLSSHAPGEEVQRAQPHVESAQEIAAPVPAAADAPPDNDSAGGTEPEEEEEDGDPRLVSTLPIAERLKLASKGSREQRAQLIRDSNRIVATAVLRSPKLTESEVEAFAKMGNVSEDVLRTIGTNRTWLKNYGIILAVTRNPKTPPAISMQLMHRLGEKDIKILTTDRNVPEALRLAARRTLAKSKHG